MPQSGIRCRSVPWLWAPSRRSIGPCGLWYAVRKLQVQNSISTPLVSINPSSQQHCLHSTAAPRERSLSNRLHCPPYMGHADDRTVRVHIHETMAAFDKDSSSHWVSGDQGSLNSKILVKRERRQHLSLDTILGLTGMIVTNACECLRGSASRYKIKHFLVLFVSRILIQQ